MTCDGDGPRIRRLRTWVEFRIRGGVPMIIVRSWRAVVVGGASAAAVLVSAWPAAGVEVRDRAHDDTACAQQYEHVGRGVSPSCLPAGERPGIEANHNETLLRDVPSPESDKG